MMYNIKRTLTEMYLLCRQDTSREKPGERRRRCVYVSSDTYRVFCTIWSHIRVRDCFIGIFESSRISGGGDHAAGRDMGGEGSDQLSHGDGDLGSGRADRKLDPVFSRKAWRRCILPVLHQEVSETEEPDREKYGGLAKKGSHRRLPWKAGADDTDADINPGRDDLDGIWQIYGKLGFRSPGLEHGIYRSGIFYGRRRMERICLMDAGYGGKDHGREKNEKKYLVSSALWLFKVTGKNGAYRMAAAGMLLRP